MNPEDPQAPAATPPPPPAPAEAAVACPVTAERLPPDKRKFVDFKGPVPGRMMAARGLVPFQPADLSHVLFMLTYDPDAKVRDTALATVKDDKNKKMLLTALKDENIEAPVLDFYGRMLTGKDDLLELVVLNNATSDETIADIVMSSGERLSELVSQNQLRLLRTPQILRNLCANPAVTRATVDLACDFAIRSGVLMDDVPQMKEARVRINGPDAPPVIQGPTADEVLEEHHETLAKPDAPPLEEGKRITLMQKVMRMNVAEKIKLATMGNKEARTLLLRESNKLVAMAAIRSPRITDGEVMLMAGSKTCQEDVLRYIYSTRSWNKDYRIKMALIRNPKVPSGIALKFMAGLRDSDIKNLADDRSVPAAIKAAAKRSVDAKNKPPSAGGGH